MIEDVSCEALHGKNDDKGTKNSRRRQTTTTTTTTPCILFLA